MSITQTPSILSDLQEQLRSLVEFYFEQGPDGLVGIMDSVTGEVVGAGVTDTEALEDALRQAREWDAAGTLYAPIFN